MEKQKNLTICKYKLNGKNKKVIFEWWEVAIKVFRVKEKYRNKFQEYKNKLDEATKRIDEEFKPILEEYKKEVSEATEKELLRQLEKQV